MSDKLKVFLQEAGADKKKRVPGRRQGRKKYTVDVPEADDAKYSCYVCEEVYDSDDDEKGNPWMGCDKKGCDSWAHVACAGFKDKIASRAFAKMPFVCKVCKVND